MTVILDESTHDIECFRDSEGIIKVKSEFDLQGNSRVSIFQRKWSHRNDKNLQINQQSLIKFQLK